MRPVLALLLMVLAAAPAAAQKADAPVSPEIGRLAELMLHRLELMEHVAAWKWRHGKPIEDKAREGRIVDGFGTAAAKHGLDPETAKVYLIEQIEGAKAVQHYWFKQWKTSGFPEDQPNIDLVTDLRPAIVRTGDAILDQLTMVAPLLRDPAGTQALKDALARDPRGQVLGAEQRDLLAEAAGAVAYGPSGTRLDQIRGRGRLRIGTTGDYPPFSQWMGEGPVGIDIDLGLFLADSLGVEAEFVPTTWPTLMEDYRAGKFDIAMSGITRTLERQKVGYFSDPYHHGGKAPIVRCGDEEKFDTLEEIDQPGVRLIVNPGGTNEKFARAHAARADLRVFEDNTRIFTEISEGRADVMVTDRIEVDFQTARNASLCPAMEGTFTYAQKAFLLPRDEAWLHYINAWLDQIARDGTLGEVFRRHVERAN